MKYINIACNFLSFGLLSIFLLQIYQQTAVGTTISNEHGDPINYWSTNLIIVPITFFALSIFCFWLAYWDHYDQQQKENKEKENNQK